MRIVVTQKDIDKANHERSLEKSFGYNHYTHCPIAQSLKRRKIDFVGVRLDKITFRGGRWRKLPSWVPGWIRDFDTNIKAVHPIRFDLDLEGVSK